MVHSWGPLSVPIQHAPHLFPYHFYPSPRLFVPATSNLLPETYRPNLQLSMPIPKAPPAFMVTSRPIDQLSSSKGKSSRQKIDKDKTQRDPIPITYTELLPKLIEGGLVVFVHLAPLRPSRYNVNARCDCHVGIPSHSIEDCVGSSIYHWTKSYSWWLRRNFISLRVHNLMRVGRLVLGQLRSPESKDECWSHNSTITPQHQPRRFEPATLLWYHLLDQALTIEPKAIADD